MSTPCEIEMPHSAHTWWSPLSYPTELKCPGVEQPAMTSVGKPGDRIVDGGLPGMMVRCPECGGTGTLHKPDKTPEPLEPATELGYVPGHWMCVPGCDYPIGQPWHKKGCQFIPNR